MDSVDVFGSRITIPAHAGNRAYAWARVIQDLDPTTEGLACLLQALITDENQRALLKVERAVVDSF